MNPRKRNRSRYRLILWMMTAVLIILIFMLSSIERNAPGSSIRSPWDAFWYFLATVTTVGYGDVSPVTPFGKAMGVLFILLSCGFISILITASIRFMNGSFMLRLQILLGRADRWYVFDSYSPECRYLAGMLWDLPENTGIIFCEAERQIRDLFKLRCIFTPLSVQDVLAVGGGSLSGRINHPPYVFLLSESEEKNLKTALSLTASDEGHNFLSSDSEKNPDAPGAIKEKAPAQIYCRTGVRFQDPPAALHTFDPAELTARAYWVDYPLTRAEKNVVLIGEGSLLNYLIEQALLVNVFGPLLRCRYHIFRGCREGAGTRPDDESFLADHPRITEVIDVVSVSGNTCTSSRMQADPENDTLCIHEEYWDSNHACLENADRIIICSRFEIDNIRIAEKIRLLCAARAQIYTYGSDSIDHVNGFGSRREIYTPERILREDLLRHAMTLNEYYNSQQSDESRKTAWEDLSMFARRSNMAAADHMSTKLRILTGRLDQKTAVSADHDTTALALRNFHTQEVDRELCRRIEHERWMRFHSMYGWTYGRKRDNTLRHHPLMVPFEDLTEAEQVLDDISWELLATLSD